MGFAIVNLPFLGGTSIYGNPHVGWVMESGMTKICGVDPWPMPVPPADGPELAEKPTDSPLCFGVWSHDSVSAPDHQPKAIRRPLVDALSKCSNVFPHQDG